MGSVEGTIAVIIITILLISISYQLKQITKLLFVIAKGTNYVEAQEAMGTNDHN